MTANLTEASRQWATRPNDQRYLSLDDLENAVQLRQNQSWTLDVPTRKLQVGYDEESLLVQAPNSVGGPGEVFRPTNWGFTQLAKEVGAPANYLSTLPMDLVARNLQYSLTHNPKVREESMVLAQTNGHQAMRAVTSLRYGRIWDSQVVQLVQEANQDGRWQVPAASYAAVDPVRATTLYASDRDVFVFLVDPDNPVEVGDERLFRGFYAWNSETGARAFGACAFYYRYVCGNRIIWGAEEVRDIYIRHSSGAPERFAPEFRQLLDRYADADTHETVEAIKRAQAFEIPNAEQKDEGWEKWLQERGFNRNQARAAVMTAMDEEGQCASLWDVIQGITASARSMTHTDARVRLEEAAGNLMRVVTNK